MKRSDIIFWGGGAINYGLYRFIISHIVFSGELESLETGGMELILSAASR